MDYEKLYETCYMQVYSYAMTLCRDGRTAEELTQEAFFKAINAPPAAQFQGRSGELTWLCAIVKNLWYDRCRRQKRMAEMPEELASDEDMAETVSDRELSFHIHRALHELPEPYKEVFQLRVFGELSFAQIGEIFGKTENWARVTYHRARIKIQERMGIHER